MGINIVPIKAAHIQQVVQVHMQGFPEFFLTFLGPKFLREFYNSFSYDPTGIGFVAEDAETGDLRKELGKNGRRRVESEFRQEIIWEGILKKYNELLSNQ